MSQSHLPFSIRPIKPPADRKPKTLTEFIARINATHPGGFRALNQAALQREIEERKQKQNPDDDNDVHMDDGPGSEEEADTEGVKDLATARIEVLRNISIAWSQANNAQQLVSLLMSKEVPTQVMATLDHQLRNMVGIGSLGSTKMHEPPAMEQKLQDNAVISTGGKLLAISKTANKLLAAATRLRNEVATETEYWREVLTVKEAGWPVARLPNEPLTLAVKFGFSDSSPEFQASSWATLNRDDDGSVSLQTHRLIAEPKRLLVSIEKDGKVVGRSSLPRPIPSDALLELRVREARDTILAQELWHEMNREARSLLACNVSLLPSAISYRMGDGTTIFFTLATLGNLPEPAGERESKAGDGYAETICAALYLLLAYSHRRNARKRSEIQALSTDRARLPKPAYPLIKPVIAYLQHETWLRSTIRFVSDLTAALRFAGIDTARYTLEEPPLPAAFAEPASEQLLTAMLGPMRFRISLNITPQVGLTIEGNTFQVNRPTSIIRFLPPLPRPQQEPGTAPQNNLLGIIYPPSDYYESLKDAFEYLLGATTRALAKHFELLAAEWQVNAPSAEKNPTVWITTIKGDAVRDLDTERRGVSFEVLGGEDDQATDGQPGGHTPASALPRITGLKIVGDQMDFRGGIVQQVRSWTLSDIEDGAPEQNERIQDVVQRVLMRTA